MSTFVVGDIHGCYQSLQQLLRISGFRPKKDRLWLVGDLVNRGPRSLEVLQWAADTEAQLGDRFHCVLGNHDLYLIARHDGSTRRLSGDTLGKLLAHREAGSLVRWLRHRPLLVREGNAILVHAGLWPKWTLAKAERAAAKVAAALSSKQDRCELLARGVSSKPTSRMAKLRWRLAVLTRMRYIDSNLALATFTGPPESAPEGLQPWYALATVRRKQQTLLFGHWASLGVRKLGHAVSLDGGCAWGGTLNALRLEDGRLYSVAALERKRKGR